jgi:exodeoxyribonuclease VII large subunit
MADRARERFELTVCRWPEPQTLFAPVAQRLDEIGDRLPRALASRAGDARANLNAVAPRLRAELLFDRISRSGERLAALWKVAELVHPDRPLSRGFVRVTDRLGATLSKAADAIAARLVILHFGDGEVEASTATGIAPVERKRRSSYVSNQPGFFDETED